MFKGVTIYACDDEWTVVSREDDELTIEVDDATFNIPVKLLQSGLHRGFMEVDKDELAEAALEHGSGPKEARELFYEVSVPAGMNWNAGHAVDDRV